MSACSWPFFLHLDAATVTKQKRSQLDHRYPSWPVEVARCLAPFHVFLNRWGVDAQAPAKEPWFSISAPNKGAPLRACSGSITKCRLTWDYIPISNLMNLVCFDLLCFLNPKVLTCNLTSASKCRWILKGQFTKKRI